MKNGIELFFLTGVAFISPYSVAHEKQHPINIESTLRLEQKEWGIAASTLSATKVIEVSMSDNMRFKPEFIKVRLGQTIRFKIHNKGAVLHEFVLGTKAEIASHAELMKRFPDMEHDEPYMAHVPPGQIQQLTWTFNREGEFQFACLMPGHFEAGMVGQVSVSKQKGNSK